MLIVKSISSELGIKKTIASLLELAYLMFQTLIRTMYHKKKKFQGLEINIIEQKGTNLVVKNTYNWFRTAHFVAEEILLSSNNFYNYKRNHGSIDKIYKKYKEMAFIRLYRIIKYKCIYVFTYRCQDNRFRRRLENTLKGCKSNCEKNNNITKNISLLFFT